MRWMKCTDFVRFGKQSEAEKRPERTHVASERRKFEPGQATGSKTKGISVGWTHARRVRLWVKKKKCESWKNEVRGSGESELRILMQSKQPGMYDTLVQKKTKKKSRHVSHKSERWYASEYIVGRTRFRVTISPKKKKVQKQQER